MDVIGQRKGQANGKREVRVGITRKFAQEVKHSVTGCIRLRGLNLNGQKIPNSDVLLKDYITDQVSQFFSTKGADVAYAVVIAKGNEIVEFLRVEGSRELPQRTGCSAL